MTLAYLTGIAIGLGLIMPIGQQNVFVFGHGIAIGLPRAMWSAVAAACCDTLLILTGAIGAAALLAGVPGLRTTLLGAGAAFLLFLGNTGATATVRPGC